MTVYKVRMYTADEGVVKEQVLKSLRSAKEYFFVTLIAEPPFLCSLTLESHTENLDGSTTVSIVQESRAVRCADRLDWTLPY